MADTYQVVITPRAEASLERIIDYLLEEVSFKTAQYVEKEILAAIDNLRVMPTRNAPAKEIISKANITYRRALALSYRIVYTIKEDQLMVLVVEIFHSKQGAPSNYEGFE